MFNFYSDKANKVKEGLRWLRQTLSDPRLNEPTCEVCGKTTVFAGYTKVSQSPLPLYWCPNCGTIQTETRFFAAPYLARKADHE